MKKFIPKKFNYLWIVGIFILWRIALLLPFVLSPQDLPLQKTYLGGEASNYLQYPYLWGWANFDGQHYLAIAQFGYRPLTYFFFPLYPLLIQRLQMLGGDFAFSYLLSGLLISNLSFIFALIGIGKLLSLDYKNKIVLITIFLLLSFPTAFYFGSVYTEGTFLALVVWSFYFARKKNWLLAVILASLSTATRVVGIAMLPALLIEWYLQNKNEREKTLMPIFLLFLVPLGLVSYMLFLKQTTGDPLAFFHSVEIFGQQRSTNMVLLPQVFYRYIFKIVPVINFSYFPVVFVTLFELATAIVFLLLSLWAVFKTRLSYAIFGLGVYLIPPLSGSFSSLPRYVLVAFPAFIVLATLLSKRPRALMLVGIIFLFGLYFAESLFLRGYWVS